MAVLIPASGIALVTGADRGLGLALVQRFAEQGWRVFAGSYLPDWPELAQLAAVYPDRITLLPLDIASDASVVAARDTIAAQVGQVDVIVNNAAVSSAVKEHNIRETLDYSEMMRLFDVNTLGALRVVQAFQPLVAHSPMKRLCFVSSEAGSISRCERTSWYSYCMSKTALNRGVQLLFDALHPEGYTFRVFHPGWMKTYMSGERNDAAELEPSEVAAAAFAYFTHPRADEDRLILRDWRGREWPW